VRGVITRAVAAIPETLDLVSGCLDLGGKMIFMKGPDCTDEIREARHSHADSYRLAAEHAYSLPETDHRRRLVVYERLIEPTPATADEPEAASQRVYSGHVKEVASASNPSFRLARDVLIGKGIRKHGRALIAGARIISEVLERFPDRAEAWITDAKGDPPPADSPDGLAWLRLEAPLYQELDVSGTHGPLLLARVPEMATWSDSEPWPDGCTLFIPFQDPENVGAVLRSAAAFGVARAVLLQEAAHPFHPKAARAAGPALFQVPLLLGPSIRSLQSSTVPLIPLHAEGSPLNSVPWPSSFGLLPGVEGPGLPDAFRNSPRARSIPIADDVESLNAATAVAVALYAWKHGA
jgi:16S rRNA (guanine527-N7)-methyltransferase